MQVSKTDKTSVELQSVGNLAVKGELSFGTVTSILEQGNDLLAEASEITIDLQGVTHSDSSGLALLLEWIGVAKQNQQSIHIINVPAQMIAIAKATGIDKILPINY